MTLLPPPLPEQGTEKARGGSMRSTVSFLVLAMNGGCGGQIGGRGLSSCSLKAGLYNPSVLPHLKTQLKKSAFLQRSLDAPLLPTSNSLSMATQKIPQIDLNGIPIFDPSFKPFMQGQI
jgi:hypothetical protein